MELAVDLDIGELGGVTPAGTPIINTRTVATTVRLLDGQPFVLASLSQRQGDESTAKAPWLGSLPLVGYLAGGEQRMARRRDLVITITPRFILASEHEMERSPRVQTLDLIVEGERDQGAPRLTWGFDQWLVGS
jgi:type II secretory pathway component GspD/PulD (secretin)